MNPKNQKNPQRPRPNPPTMKSKEMEKLIKRPSNSKKKSQIPTSPKIISALKLKIRKLRKRPLSLRI